MPYGLYISAAGAEVQARRMELLTNNLANAETVGFKRELAMLSAQHSEAIEQGAAYPGSKQLSDIGGGVEFKETMTDFSTGSMKQTGLKTDVAIENPQSFFVVQDEQGQQLLTRAGNFQTSAEGQLKTTAGHTVLNADNEPIVIDPALPFNIDEGGFVVQADQRTPLALVKPNSMGDLARRGQNTFLPLAPPQPVEPTERKVRSGFLEQSTVKPVQEMMELIQTSRAYEANVRLIQNQDNMIGSLVNRVLRQG